MNRHECRGRDDSLQIFAFDTGVVFDVMERSTLLHKQPSNSCIRDSAVNIFICEIRLQQWQRNLDT